MGAEKALRTGGQKKDAVQGGKWGEVWFLGGAVGAHLSLWEKSGLTSEPGRLVIHTLQLITRWMGSVPG